MQNLIYALIQVVHNFGAAAVIGIATYGLRFGRNIATKQRRLLVFMAVAWAVQGASGASFGITSLYYYGKLPDIHGTAVAALFVKMTCVLTGFIIAVAALKTGSAENPKRSVVIWLASLALGATALSAAAFLRWFS